MNFVFQLERDVASPEPVSRSPPAHSDTPPAPFPKPPPATQQATARTIPSARPRPTGISSNKAPGSQPAVSAKGKEVDRSNVAPVRGLGKNKEASSASSLPTKPSSTAGVPQAATPLFKTPIVPDPPAPAPRPRLSTLGSSTIKTVKSSVRRPGPTPIASSSKAASALLFRAKAKRPFPALSDSSSDENAQAGGSSGVADGHGVRKSLGLTKVPIPKAGGANVRTGRRESDSSISAEGMPRLISRAYMPLTSLCDEQSSPSGVRRRKSS